MRSTLPNRNVDFRHEDGCLVRTVTGADGRHYTHRCAMAAYEKVAHALNETPATGNGTTMAMIATQECIPFTQANVAFEFMKERGLVEVRHRRCYPASSEIYLDAMVEWHALSEKPERA
jgi:hypothetical protein